MIIHTSAMLFREKKKQTLMRNKLCNRYKLLHRRDILQLEVINSLQC